MCGGNAGSRSDIVPLFECYFAFTIQKTSGGTRNFVQGVF